MGLAYSRPLEAVGAVPLHLPFLEDVAAALAVADGVVLGFGSDIDPARYGGAPHPAMTPHSARRDAFELELARAALAAGMPVLGICRGMQVLNVVRGGTLWVNSYHHQAVDALGSGVVAVAWAEDGLVEALELDGEAWVLGVQWELQESWKDDPRSLAVFDAFVSATARPGSAASSSMKRPPTRRAAARWARAGPRHMPRPALDDLCDVCCAYLVERGAAPRAVSRPAPVPRRSRPPSARAAPRAAAPP